MASKFPHRYEMTLASQDGTTGELSSGGRPILVGGPPPEFGGNAELWSPEHLFLGAISLCLMTTFTALAQKEGLSILDYRCEAKEVLDKTSQGLVFTSIDLFVKLSVGPEDVSRAKQTLEKAERYCIISNSIKTKVEVHAEVTAPPTAPQPNVV